MTSRKVCAVGGARASYLLIFNRPVSWTKNVHIMNWLALEVGLESGNENVRRYVNMQCIKENSTVRISRKDKKSPPKVIFRYGSQDKQIRKFLATRRFLLWFLNRR
jgi:hypothetical protein